MIAATGSKPARAVMNTTNVINIIGAGLAGSEAAWQAAERGCHVHLYEMRPHQMTPAHTTVAVARYTPPGSLADDFMYQSGHDN